LLVGHRRAPLRPKPIRARKKIRLENGFQQELRRHLHHPVPDRRDPKRPLHSIGLRNVLATNHLRPVLACSQLGSELFEEELDSVLLDVEERLTIDSSGASVPPYSDPCLPED